MKNTPEGVDENSNTVDMNSMLMFLALQLEMTVEQSHRDYDVISNFCIKNIESTSDNGVLIKSMQSYDLSYQRIQHVIALIERIIQLDKNTHLVEPNHDLLKEFNKVTSFYSKRQADDLLNALPIKHLKNNSHENSAGDDMEFF